jgi:hypothetical protein
MHPDTVTSIYGGAPPSPPGAPLAVAYRANPAVPAYVDPLKGTRGMDPRHSPTPYVVGMFIILALLLHPKAGFSAGAKVG